MEEARFDYCQRLYEVAAAVNSGRAPQLVLDSMVENVAKAMAAKGYEALWQDMLEWRAALGHEWAAEGPMALAER